jgi:hypothetical protein
VGLATHVEPSAGLAERPGDLPYSCTWCRRFTPSPFADGYRELSEDPRFEDFDLDTGHQCVLTMPRETTDIILSARLAE